MLLISLTVSTCLVVTDAVTSPSPSNELQREEDPDVDLMVALMMPRTGELGFERNAAAATLAIDQAQRDGLLQGVKVRCAVVVYQ